MQSKINSLFNSFSFIPKSVDSSKFCSDQFNYKGYGNMFCLHTNKNLEIHLGIIRDGQLFLFCLYRIKNRLLPSPVSERAWTLYSTTQIQVQGQISLPLLNYSCYAQHAYGQCE
ncbi:hypothetical protein H5410_002818 [Solanum commersonii]|uniref:Uncharacterized protein n=1 Tax=Solanum commersonii TaxID=4109 RepID=A0A9J6B2W9_SOLCO|nr:hypothetical protein H5410_002818 [Solanum commersonii]